MKERAIAVHATKKARIKDCQAGDTAQLVKCLCEYQDPSVIILNTHMKSQNGAVRLGPASEKQRQRKDSLRLVGQPP